MRAALGVLGMLPIAAAAQGYPQLHLVALAQRADRAAVEPNGVFHVTIHVRIAQHRERLDELILGMFGNCEIISNETVRVPLPEGTDFVERLTVQALAPGVATVSPAYIDALDPALGKPMRFSSNAIAVRVTGASALDAPLSTFARVARRLLLAVAIVGGLFAAAFVVGVLFLRRKRRPATAVPPPIGAAAVPLPGPPAALSERLVQAAQAYSRERSAATLGAVRAILFGLAGAAAGATLVDALRALGERDGRLRAALLAAERAAFGPAGERASAGDAMVAAIQAYCERRPANEGGWTR